MSFRLEMLQVARLAPKLLGDSGPLVERFVRSQLAGEGGFQDRAGQSDLYYTAFGLDCLLALRVDVPAGQLRAYLEGFGDGDGLDLVHLCCLVRCWAGLAGGRGAAQWVGPARERLLLSLDRFRSEDGGYAPTPGGARGTVYAAFLAWGAVQELGGELRDPVALQGSLDRLRAADGGYANQEDVATGQTPATAAALTMRRHLGAPPDLVATEWLRARRHADGGLFATATAPMPDLLSTATGLHALSGPHAPSAPERERHLDFLDTLWSNRGGFVGHWADDLLDVEYLFYALLALGHLSL